MMKKKKILTIRSLSIQRQQAMKTTKSGRKGRNWGKEAAAAPACLVQIGSRKPISDKAENKNKKILAAFQIGIFRYLQDQAFLSTAEEVAKTTEAEEEEAKWKGRREVKQKASARNQQKLTHTLEGNTY